MVDFRARRPEASATGAVGVTRTSAAPSTSSRPRRSIAAGTLIRTGKVFDLGIPFGAGGPQPGGGRINPVLLVSENGTDQKDFPGPFHYADDYIFMPLQAASQWDGLAHVFYDEKLYNGFPSSRRHAARRAPLLDHRDGQGHHRPRACCSTSPVSRASSGWSRATSSRPTTSTRPPPPRAVRGRLRRHPAVPHRLAPQVHPGAGPRVVHGRRAGPRPGLPGVAVTTTRWPWSARTTGPSRCCPAR